MVEVRGSLSSCDHEMVEFRIMRGRMLTLDFRKVVFGHLGDLLGGIPWELNHLPQP